MRLIAALAATAVLLAGAPASSATKGAPAKGAAAKAKKAEPAPAPEPVAPPAAEPPKAVEATPVPAEPKAPETPKRSSAPMRVAVLDPQKTGDIPERALVGFLQSLVPELRKLEGIAAIGMSEVRDMLAFEKQRQLLGCGDESCLAEIGGALGVDELVTVQLVLTGTKYSLSMKRMNLRKAKVVQAEQRVFDKRDGEELLSIVGPMVEALYPDRQLKEGKTRGVEEAVIKRLNPPPLPRWVFVATGAAAVVAAGVGGGFSLLQQDKESQWKDKIAAGGTISGAELVKLEKAANDNRRNAIIFYCAGGGLAVVAAIEAIFTDWHDDRLSLAVGPTGVGVAGKF